mmetsp:Transcript_22304/g.61957  ORF Transcript_22304/g.61957 Transcript_22304/m.61957 type:complete len:1022 (+) Transcript_22304:68-3133(+)
MVKNRNWQVRVEAAVERRRETKQKSEARANKKVFKGWVHSLLSELDQNQDYIYQQKCRIHLWTQVVPKVESSPPLLLDLLEDTAASPGKRGGGRARSASTESENSTASLKRKKQQARYFRARSSSIESEGSAASRKSNKKQNPQAMTIGDSSFSSVNSSNSNSLMIHPDSPSMLLCRHHFLWGRCDGRSGGKRGVCKYFHYKSSSKYPSLARILQSTTRNNDDRSLLLGRLESAMRSATPEDLRESDPGASEMLYYSCHDCDMDDSNAADHGSNRLSDQVVTQLAGAETPLASVVYVAVGDTLVYDRNQGGVLQEEMDASMHELLIQTRKQRPRQSSVESMTSQTESAEEELNADAIDFPAAILEHILTFLPDFSVGACSQVCKAWNCEIGQHSPNLWLHLLQRHGWEQKGKNPSNLIPSAPSTASSQGLKELYQNHYVALRDVRALASAVPPILTNKHALHATVEEKEVTYESFASRKHSPHETDSCIALEEWSPNHVIAGYANECKLRLFKAVPFRGHEKRCKELVCQSVDPYRLTKKRTCTLDAVALDEETIGCLCHVSASSLHQGITAFLLIILSREDFLMSENSAVAAKSGACESSNLGVIDIGEAVLNHILSSDHVDSRLLPLFDFLSDGGSMGDVCVAVSRHGIEAVGYGRFMVEVSISIPNDNIHENDVEDHDMMMIHLDRKLVLFSSSVGAIVWMGESYPAHQLPPAHAIPAVMASFRRPRGTSGGESLPDKCVHTTHSIVVASMLSPSLLICDVESSGIVQPPRMVGNSEVVRHSLRQGFETYPSRCLLVSPTDIISKDSVFRNNDDGDLVHLKSSLSFFSRFPSSGENPHSILHLLGHVRIHDFICLREEYILALCTEYVEESFFTTSIGLSSEDEDPAESDGQWFVPPHDNRESTLSTEERHTIIVVHIPSRTEIGRVPFNGTTGNNYEALKPRLIKSPGATVALALGGFGLAMTGDDVRDLGGADFHSFSEIDYESSPRSNKKKKPGRTKNKNGSRKDRFTRGLSMRG